MMKKKELNVEIDEQWSYVGNKSRQVWNLRAIDSKSRRVLAFVNGERTKENFEKLFQYLQFFDIERYFTDGWKVYEKYIPKEKHEIGKAGTQRIERQNLTLRARIKRLNRKTISFSKSFDMHHGLLSLFITSTLF